MEQKGVYRRPTFLVVVPTFGMVSIKYHVAAQRLQAPVNSTIASMVIEGEEIGAARNRALQYCLSLNGSMPENIFFFGDDMIPEWWHLIRLWEEMRKGQWDILSALYFMKMDDVPTPILWREEITGPMREGEHYQLGDVVESDIAGMDFTLINPHILSKLEPPYFKTSFTSSDDQYKNDAVSIFTEDAYFCKKVRDVGGRIGVHTGVRVAHLNIKTGELY